MVASRPSPEKWQFQARFRKAAFGVRSTHLAVGRIREALVEIKACARIDPMRGAEGAIVLLRRLSPALENVDSSSGALGTAVGHAIDELVTVLVAAPADDATRHAWLGQIWDAFMADRVPYLEGLGYRWGDVCANTAIASTWADALLPELRDSFALPGRGGSYFHGTIACLSALLAAERYEELLDVIEHAPFVWWTYRQWGFRALIAQGRRADAIRYAESSRDTRGSDTVPIARACERVLLESGMAEEAYRRCAIAASAMETTYLARFRSLAKKYPWKPANEILTDLVATTPGKEGKWFAAARSAGLYDDAIALANATQCDPKTLSRAARDSIRQRPGFALEAAVASLRWFAEGYGFEVTSIDVVDAYGYGLEAAKAVDRVAEYGARVRTIVAAGDRFVRDVLAPRLR